MTPTVRQARRVLKSRGIPLENEGSYVIRRGMFYLQRPDPEGLLQVECWFGAKSTARRFMTRDAAERFILDVLGHAYDLVVVHLLPRGTIARRERRTIRDAIKRVSEDVHGPIRFWFERLIEELS